MAVLNRRRGRGGALSAPGLLSQGGVFSTPSVKPDSSTLPAGVFVINGVPMMINGIPMIKAAS